MGGPIGGFGPFGGFGGGLGGGGGGQWIGPFLIPIPNFGGVTTTGNRNAAARGQAEFCLPLIAISVFIILEINL